MTDEEIKEYWRTAYCNEKYKKEQLEKENAELKKDNEGYEKDNTLLVNQFNQTSAQLIKAIGIIKRWYETNSSACIEPSQELIEVTEQFLSEVEK